MIKPRTYVPPAGDLKKAKIAFVGEQPGKREVYSTPRKPFIGPAGKVLEECLMAIGIARDDCYLTNVIKDLDKPLEHYIRISKTGTTLSQEGLHYLDFLKRELSQLNTRVIIAVGNIALNALCDKTGITNWRGSIIECEKIKDKIIIPTFHPATVLPPKNVYLNKLLIQFDIKKALNIIENGYKPVEWDLKIRPSFFECVQILDDLYKRGKNGETIDFDIELFNEEVSCISFTYGSGAVSIPFIYEHGDYFSIEQETTVWKKIAKLIEDNSIRKRGQNLSFDTHFLLRRFGIKTHNFDDTMVAQKILMPDYPIGLDFITSIWTNQPYYKADGKKWSATGNWDMLWRYNDLDSLICKIAFPKQNSEIERQGNRETYERQIKIIEPLVYMQEHGIKIDVEGMKKAHDDLGLRIEEMKEELKSLCGFDLNPNSPKQVSTYFYTTKGVKPYTKKGSVTVDEKALIRLSRKGFRESSKILDIRRAIKKRSTYLDVSKVDQDGRMRCSYNPVGTRFSRVSSSKNIFGTGMNLQNQPHDVLEFFKPDNGYIAYSIDLSQAENRIVAYVGQVWQMMEAFEKGIDVHSLTASLIFDLPIEEIIRQDKENIYCNIGKKDKSYRFYGKKSNHALNYDEGYKTFSLDLEIPETQGKFLVERYHLAYPNVRQKYHRSTQRQLSKNRIITNLMGRKTLFLDEWGDSLFKAGYSCIPQGTVGDVINERGLNYIYYNEEFKPVELMMQVHDSIVFQLPLSLSWLEHAEILIKIKESLETPLETSDGTSFVIPADISLGFDLYKKNMKEISHKNFPKTSSELAERLECLANSMIG